MKKIIIVLLLLAIIVVPASATVYDNPYKDWNWGTGYPLTVGPYSTGSADTVCAAAGLTSRNTAIGYVTFASYNSAGAGTESYNVNFGSTKTTTNVNSVSSTVKMYCTGGHTTVAAAYYNAAEPTVQIAHVVTGGLSYGYVNGTAPLNITFVTDGTAIDQSYEVEMIWGDGTNDVFPIIAVPYIPGTSNVRYWSHLYTVPGVYTVTLKGSSGVNNGIQTNTSVGLITIGLPPVASFTCVPSSGDAPVLLTCTDSSTNSPTYWWWQLLDLDNGSNVLDSMFGTLSTFNPYIPDGGNYSVTLSATNDLGTDATYHDYYFTGFVPEPTPTPYPTPQLYPNATPVPVIPTLDVNLTIFINRTDYRDVIEDTLIGNITGPYLDFVDEWTDSIIDYIHEFMENVSYPLDYLTDTIDYIVILFKTTFDTFYNDASIWLYWFGLFLATIPATVWALINYKLIIEVIKAILES